MTSRKNDDAPTVTAKQVLSYPGADGKTKKAKAGQKITDAAENWPPEWVINSGWVQVQHSQISIKKGDE